MYLLPIRPLFIIYLLSHNPDVGWVHVWQDYENINKEDINLHLSSKFSRAKHSNNDIRHRNQQRRCCPALALATLPLRRRNAAAPLPARRDTPTDKTRVHWAALAPEHNVLCTTEYSFLHSNVTNNPIVVFDFLKKGNSTLELELVRYKILRTNTVSNTLFTAFIKNGARVIFFGQQLTPCCTVF